MLSPVKFLNMLLAHVSISEAYSRLFHDKIETWRSSRSVIGEDWETGGADGSQTFNIMSTVSRALVLLHPP